ncbi:cytochrome c-type biogenesis protein [Porphyrobacter sp. ULC335]|jgi:cytochrome c-type biogenesis protein CcmH/NrfF|uniref:cytochrome c-type biogenesis protein n=1 Tax=Porphyrobacter sp. ULC335 TaxID=2854260 RepID=UPI00221F2307|nr:cytochrome c-type biogenesis protein [Porphyrobacter sp. ULC335]UYV14482.1 cytochrome c-type biogenesis protein CcmH [Porphyrobacter sp. ULC335]
MIRAALALLLAFLAMPVLAQDTMPPAPYAYNQLDDPRLEAEATELMHSLRCLKCQSQSIADSDAPMAGDMRHQVRSRILAGESPDQIRSWLIARYGDYVSYEPEVSATTWPLFAVPVLVILIVAGVLLRRLGKRRGDGGEAA